LIDAQGVAPYAQVLVTGRMVDLAAYPTITLVAPVGVEFLFSCSPTPCSRVLKNFGGTGRDAAYGLAANAGEFSLHMRIPPAWEDSSWVALIPHDDSGSNSTGTARGAVLAPLWHASSSVVMRMMPVALAYPAVSGAQDVRMTISLQPGIGASGLVATDRSCLLHVQPPAGYGIRCSGHFRPVALPVLSQASCSDGSGTHVIVTISALDVMRLRSISEIVLVLSLTLPAETPSSDLFQIILLTKNNITADANTAIPGLTMPSPKLQSLAVLAVGQVENLAWLQAWSAAAEKSGALQEGFAAALRVSAAAVSIDHVEPRLLSSGRRLQAEPASGEVAINFAVAEGLSAESPNSESKLLRRMRDETFGGDLSAELAKATADAGLAPLTLGTARVAQPSRVQPPNVTQSLIRWISAVAGQVSRVSFSVFFKGSTDVVQALLFVLPTGFVHELQDLSGLRVTTSASDFPLAAEWGQSWAQAWSRSLLRVLVAGGARVAAGIYSFEFPVRLPEELPALNVWKICLCTSAACDSPSHTSVVTILVLPGFRFGEQPPLVATSVAAQLVPSMALEAATAILLTTIMVLRH